MKAATLAPLNGVSYNVWEAKKTNKRFFEGGGKFPCRF
jgi:hypothetical protein